MPRQARVVMAGTPHHVTQRGTNRGAVFASRADRAVYLELLRVHCGEVGVRLLAYCLMENHVHLVCVPEEEDSLAICLRRTHGRYAQYFNPRRQRSGHLWQSRFYSCPMDEMHLWAAIRYVELNPVRAGMVERAERYGYSSAAAHVGGGDGGKLLDMEFWRESGAGEEWGERLRVAETGEELRKMRRATYAGSALGDEAFVAKFRELRKAKRGVVAGGGMWG